MRIGEVARRAGVNVETLRYYERRGLLAEPARGINGHRDYDEETVRFVKAVKEAQRLGFTLEEIAEHARLTRGGRAARSRSHAGRAEAGRDRRADREPAPRARGARARRRVRLRLARPLHVRRGLPRPRRARPAARAAAPRDERRERRQHAAADALGGAVLSWQDVLHEGPVPDVPPAELRAVRARFLSECGWGSERSLLESLERRDRLFEQALEGGTDVVLWFEHDLYDQLQLLQALTLAGDSRLELIQADADLGPLPPDGLEALWPQRRPVSLHTRALAREAWDAFRAPEPTGLAELAEPRHARAAPPRRALRRLLEELPGRPDRPLAHRAAAARAAARRAAAAVRALPREPGARGGGVPGRRLGVEAAGRARAAGRGAAGAAAARRPAGVPVRASDAHAARPQGAGGEGRPRRGRAGRPLARRDPRRRGLALGRGYATTSAAGPTIRLKRGTTSSTLSCAQKAMSSSSPGGP